MGCSRCSERADALRRASASIVRGNMRDAGRQFAGAAKSFAQDVRSGALQRDATARLAALRKGRR